MVQHFIKLKMMIMVRSYDKNWTNILKQWGKASLMQAKWCNKIMHLLVLRKSICRTRTAIKENSHSRKSLKSHDLIIEVGIKVGSFDDLAVNRRYKENFFAMKDLRRMNITIECTF